MTRLGALAVSYMPVRLPCSNIGWPCLAGMPRVAGTVMGIISRNQKTSGLYSFEKRCIPKTLSVYIAFRIKRPALVRIPVIRHSRGGYCLWRRVGNFTHFSSPSIVRAGTTPITLRLPPPYSHKAFKWITAIVHPSFLLFRNVFYRANLQWTTYSYMCQSEDE